MTHFFAYFSSTVHPYKSRSVFRKTPFSQKFTSTFQPSRGKTARISTLSLLTSLNPKCAAFLQQMLKKKFASSSLTPPRFDCFLNSEKPFLGQQFDICEFSCQNISLFNDSQATFCTLGTTTDWVRHNVRKCANVPRRSCKSLIHTEEIHGV